MKKIILIFVNIFIFSATVSFAAPSANKSSLRRALRLSRSGNYALASQILHRLSKSRDYIKRKDELNYFIGVNLYKMKLYQTAAFRFISVVKGKNSRFIGKSLTQLSLAADKLGDDTTLKYALSKVNIKQFPKSQRSILFFRIGETQIQNKDYAAAVKSLKRVSRRSSWYRKAKYLEGMAYSFLKKNNLALRAFNKLSRSAPTSSANDDIRIMALLSKARVYYQAKKWKKAIQYYKEIPRDSQAWHESLFESSWAMMRSGKFRSAISNFQTIHSPYYSNRYQPESLILRSIVYLYICQYDEMEKTLKLFNKIYKPLKKNISTYLKRNKRASKYFKDLANFSKNYKHLNYSESQSKIPFLVARKIIDRGDVKKSFIYLNRLVEERKIIRKVGRGWRSSSLGKQSRRLLNKRILRARNQAGRRIHSHLIKINAELVNAFEQEAFIRLEILNAKRTSLKKQVADQSDLDVKGDLARSRDFYIKNGYEYWPFQGEYWLDELGNYHYVGASHCR